MGTRVESQLCPLLALIGLLCRQQYDKIYKKVPYILSTANSA